MNKSMHALYAATALVFAAAISTPAGAVTVSGDSFAIGTVHTGTTDCPITGGNNGGFSGCWATQTGVFATANGDPLASRSVAQIGLNGTSDTSSFYPTISGSEFTLTQSGNNLLFTYVMGAGDPVLRYLSIMQANSYQLFYDAAGFTSGTTYSFNLAAYFPNNIGVSHITVYDSAGPVPEPATWAMMLLGFTGIGMTIRRRRSRNVLAQVA